MFLLSKWSAMFFGDGLSKCVTKVMYYLDNSILEMACLLTHIRFWNSDKFAGLFGMLQMERLADMKDQLDKMKNQVNISALLGNISSHSANIIANSILQANVYWRLWQALEWRGFGICTVYLLYLLTPFDLKLVAQLDYRPELNRGI